MKWFRNEVEVIGTQESVMKTKDNVSQVKSEIVIDDLGRVDVHSELTCRSGNNNRSNPLSSTVHLDMNCKYDKKMKYVRR